ncbi:hypothetical protein [Mycobacteroides chelonae]|uniref:hypothetical protein n=1 Tax=Mycobacteroides chelonae TaxID=1774 RepID=UPI0004AB5E5F|nr:hypothetical protein [Mycobacteroides chelonae]OHT70293.1 hypothetical protein BKG66_14020 [Mycobacteroides chelonae]OHT71227.1 hypothetical protein BKG67_14575 [Mycobacteroides chelonae]OHT85727.1 hypothetical protein BKG70_14725 [Mycobacteroides chelonae]
MNDPAVRGLLRSVARDRRTVHVDVPRSVATGIGQLRGQILTWYLVAGAVAIVIGTGAVGARVALAQSAGERSDAPTPVVNSVSTTPTAAPVTVTATETGTSTRTVTETVTSHSTATVTATSTATETTTETVPTTVTNTTTVTVPTTVTSTTTVTVAAPSSGGRCRPNPC